MSRAKKYYLIGVIAAVILFAIGGWAYVHYFKSSKASLPPMMPPSTVATTIVKQTSFQPQLQAIGNVKASQSIDVSSEVAGTVKNIHFISGQTIQAGQSLVVIDADDVAAEVRKAQATLANDSRYYQRQKALLPSHFVSEADVDAEHTKVKEDEAALNQYQAELQQHYITAPFSGIVGINQVDLGQYIKPGDTIVNLEQLTPAYIDFSIPEKYLSLIHVGDRVQMTTQAYPKQVFEGKIIATSSRIDENSRSLAVRAVAPNNDKKLLSGMSVNLILPQTGSNAILIPQVALSYDPKGALVYVIDSRQIAHLRYVQVGERRGDHVVILSGLKAGETAVIAGQQKLHEGSKVQINNNVLPSSQ